MSYASEILLRVFFFPFNIPFLIHWFCRGKRYIIQKFYTNIYTCIRFKFYKRNKHKKFKDTDFWISNPKLSFLDSVCWRTSVLIVLCYMYEYESLINFLIDLSYWPEHHCMSWSVTCAMIHSPRCMCMIVWRLWLFLFSILMFMWFRNIVIFYYLLNSFKYKRLCEF